MIDTLAMYKKLVAAGLEARQAEAITQAIFLAYSARSNNLICVTQEQVETDFPGKNTETTQLWSH